MNRSCRNLIFLLTFCFFLVPPAHALDPINIVTSIPGPPPLGSDGSWDVNYHPNNANDPGMIKCVTNLNVSQEFQPHTSGVDANSQPVYQPYNVTEISKTVNLDQTYSNKGPQDAYYHTANRPKAFYYPDKLKQAFLSYDIRKPFGASNMANRMTSYKTLQCLKGQRLIKAAITVISPNSNQTSCNEQVGWACKGIFYSYEDKKDGSNCDPIRLSDIAAALKNENDFYDPAAKCGSDPAPEPMKLPFNLKDNHIVSTEDAGNILARDVQVVDNCSLAKRIEVCDKDSAGLPINCVIKEQQEPLAGPQATNQFIVTQTLYKSQIADVPKYNLCQTSTYDPSPHKPNPLNFFARIVQAFGQIVNQAKTFTGTALMYVYIDPRINIDHDQAFLNNLLPKTEQLQFQTAELKGSSTDGNTIDPGNPVARSRVSKDLHPKNF